MESYGSLKTAMASGLSIATKDYVDTKTEKHNLKIEGLSTEYWVYLDDNLINTQNRFKSLLDYAKRGIVSCEYPDEETSVNLKVYSNAVNSAVDPDYSITNFVVFQFADFDLMITYNEESVPYCKITKLSHGGEYVLPVATADTLGGIQLFGETEELPENSVPVQLQDGKAYVKSSSSSEAYTFSFSYDPANPTATSWTTENKSGSINIFTILYDKDRNVVIADINVKSDVITVNFDEALQEGDSYVLLYSSSAGGATPDSRVDNTTIELNTDNLLQVKDGGLPLSKLEPALDVEDQGKVPMVGNSGDFELKSVTKVITVSRTKSVGGDTVPDLTLAQCQEIYNALVLDRVPVQIRINDYTAGGYETFQVVFASPSTITLIGWGIMVQYTFMTGFGVSTEYFKINWS